MQFYSFCQRLFCFHGSSFVPPAYGWSGTKATINYNSSAAEKKSGEARKQAGKKKKGCGKNEFLPACRFTEVERMRGGYRFKFNLVEMSGFEPPTSCLPDKRSPTELHPHINQLKLE